MSVYLVDTRIDLRGVYFDFESVQIDVQIDLILKLIYKLIFDFDTRKR